MNSQAIIENYKSDLELDILSCLIIKPKLFEEIRIESKHFIKYKKFYNYFLQIYKKYNALTTNLLIGSTSNSNEMINFAAELLQRACSINSFHSYEIKQLELYKEYTIAEMYSKLEKKEITVEDFNKLIIDLDSETFVLERKKSLNDVYDLISTENQIVKFDKLISLGSKVKFKKNTFNIIAARPSVGKSAFALNMAEDLSKNYNCLYFNMEMTEREIYERLVAINTSIPIKYFTCQTKRQVEVIEQSLAELLSRNLKIITGSKNLNMIRQIVINEQKTAHTLVFIDYIGYVTTNEKFKTDRERIGEVIRNLQNLTKDYDITIFCLAQINREGADEPSLLNLKDSGELEQSGHAIVLLHNASFDPLNDDTPLMKIIIAKNRDYIRGVFEMNYDKNTQQFKEIEVNGIEKYTRITS